MFENEDLGIDFDDIIMESVLAEEQAIDEAVVFDEKDDIFENNLFGFEN